MENIDVDALQRQLAERIEMLDRQRREQAAQFNKEVEDRASLAAMERAQQLAKYEEDQKRRDAKKLAEAEAEQIRAQEATRARIALENSLAAAEEARKAQEEKLQWLVSEIAKQEFIEEQHSKAMQSTAIAIGPTEYVPTAVNVENPVAPDNKGDAVEGTSGATQSELMSNHLKHILRQATRQY